MASNEHLGRLADPAQMAREGDIAQQPEQAAGHGRRDPGLTAAPPVASLESPVMTVDELAALLRVNRKSVYEAIARGEIPGVRRIGRTFRASREAVLAWLREGRVSRSRR